MNSKHIVWKIPIDAAKLERFEKLYKHSLLEHCVLIKRKHSLKVSKTDKNYYSTVGIIVKVDGRIEWLFTYISLL